MAQILIRGLKPEIVKRLKSQAKRHGRSLEGEARSVLEAAAGFTIQEARVEIEKWRKHLRGRKFSDSTELLREDRSR
jgi:antitoxin FitA